jgi:hypothetical protein
MTLEVTHATPADDTFSSQGAAAWNAGHTVALGANLGALDSVISFVSPGGRLTLTSGTPVTTSDVTSTSVYYTPYVHNVIALWDGSTWKPLTFTETTIALGTVSSGKPYDVFAYISSDALALETLVWTDDTTRATGISLQDGRYCKTGDKTRLYLGTFYTVSTTQTEDSAAKRFLWNAYNRRRRSMRVVEATDSWTYSTATLRQTNGATANQLDYLVGLAEDAVEARVIGRASSSTSTFRSVTTAIGVDSTSVASGLITNIRCSVDVIIAPVAVYEGIPGVGRHFLAWLERGAGVDTQTWYGDAGVPTVVQAGILGSVFA